MKIKELLSRTASRALSVAWPPTRTKLHRLLHGTGVAVTVAALVAVWFVGHMSLPARLGADFILLASFLTRWQVAFRKIDAVVDLLPIPEGDDGKAPPHP